MTEQDFIPGTNLTPPSNEDPDDDISSSDPILREKARGCLVGLAIGDALGFPLEGLSANRIQRRFGNLNRYRFLGRVGFVSDDTEQAVMLAESLLESQGKIEEFNKLFSQRLVKWFWTLPPGVGLATLRACLKLTLGIQNGVYSAGNGAAMRSPPLGLWPQREQIDTLAVTASRLTHNDPRAIDGARVVAWAVSELLYGKPADYPTLEKKLPTLHSELLAALHNSWTLSQNPTSEPSTCIRSIGNSGFVLHSVPLAFYGLWRNPPSFLEGLQCILKAGGDTDSNGAITGALLGTRFGASHIPAYLQANLEPVFGKEHLYALADSLVQGKLIPNYKTAGFWQHRLRESLVKIGVALHVLSRLMPW